VVCPSQRMLVPFHILQHRALGCPRSRNRGDEVHGGARAVDVCSRSWGRQEVSWASALAA
jgi:hypothetical protein